MIRYFLLLFSLPLVFSSLEKIGCHNVRNFAIDLSNGTDARVYEAELSILFSRDKLRVFNFQNTDLVNIILNDTVVIFKGDLVIGNSLEQSQRIDEASYYQAWGTAKLKNHYFHKKLENCKIFLSKNGNDSRNIPEKVENQIQTHAEVCMINDLCKKLGSIKSNDIIELANHSEFPISSDDSQRKVQTSFSETGPHSNYSSTNSVEVHSYINTIVDVVLREIINHLKKKHNERISIPNIDQKFSVGSGILKTNGRFTTKNGYFSDITTLKRTNDAVFERQGYKFSVSCGFGVSKALIEYSQYKLKFGIIKLDGIISANIEGISIEAKVSVDYNLRPCKMKIEYFKIVNYGKITIDVTGLSPFNSLASYLVSWISKKWEDEIIGIIKSKITKIVDYEINKFNCEKYRP